MSVWTVAMEWEPEQGDILKVSSLSLTQSFCNLKQKNINKKIRLQNPSITAAPDYLS